MIEPVNTYSSLLASAVLLTTSIALLAKIHFGSRSKFAYVLTFFSFSYGIVYGSQYLSNSLLIEIEVDGKKEFFPDFYSTEAENFIYRLLSLQQWIFAMKYI